MRPGLSSTSSSLKVAKKEGKKKIWRGVGAFSEKEKKRPLAHRCRIGRRPRRALLAWPRGRSSRGPAGGRAGSGGSPTGTRLARAPASPRGAAPGAEWRRQRQQEQRRQQWRHVRWPKAAAMEATMAAAPFRPRAAEFCHGTDLAEFCPRAAWFRSCAPAAPC